MDSDLKAKLTKKISTLNVEVWVLIAICFGFSIVTILAVLSSCLSRNKSKKRSDKLPNSQNQTMSIEIKEIKVDNNAAHHHPTYTGSLSDKDASNLDKTKNPSFSSPSGSFNHLEKYDIESGSGESRILLNFGVSSSHQIISPSPLFGLPEFSHLGWGHWFTLRDLEVATNRFSKDNVIGEGGYGVVYRGYLVNGTPVAVKKLFNNLGQAEKEFRVEVEAIGHVRHKNLVRLLGYCIEGLHRLLVYEYVNNGNLEQWLHGAMQHEGCLTWVARMKIILGTARALMYLHEAIEPKVVHRDIKSSNILVDDEFNAKLSDFGLAKLLTSGTSHVTTRVMGTFGYVAPEYANSGLLNEKSDVYSFGVLLLEAITGRNPVDYTRPSDEVHLVDWLKMMVGCRRSEEVVDPNMVTKPSRVDLKRALLTALRCVDPDAGKRLTMGEVVRMLERDDYSVSRESRRRRNNEDGSTEVESQSQSQMEPSDTESGNRT